MQNLQVSSFSLIGAGIYIYTRIYTHIYIQYMDAVREDRQIVGVSVEDAENRVK